MRQAPLKRMSQHQDVFPPCFVQTVCRMLALLKGEHCGSRQIGHFALFNQVASPAVKRVERQQMERAIRDDDQSSIDWQMGLDWSEQQIIEFARESMYVCVERRDEFRLNWLA